MQRFTNKKERAQINFPFIQREVKGNFSWRTNHRHGRPRSSLSGMGDKRGRKWAWMSLYFNPQPALPSNLPKWMLLFPPPPFPLPQPPDPQSWSPLSGISVRKKIQDTHNNVIFYFAEVPSTRFKKILDHRKIKKDHACIGSNWMQAFQPSRNDSKMWKCSDFHWWKNNDPFLFLVGGNFRKNHLRSCLCGRHQRDGKCQTPSRWCLCSQGEARSSRWIPVTSSSVIVKFALPSLIIWSDGGENLEIDLPACIFINVLHWQSPQISAQKK